MSTQKSTNERLQLIAEVLLFINSTTKLNEHLQALKGAIATDEVVTHFKAIIDEKLNAEDKTPEIVRLALIACLSADYISLRQYNHGVSKSYKDQVVNAIQSGDLNELCDAISAVYCGFVAACTMPA
ncbi:MAG: hypothetical protein ACI9TY_000934 [Alphaproteobacteria bacterium]|jgi:hypothetical protein